MPSDGEELLIVCGAMVLFSAGWVARGIADALVGMLGAAWTYFREQTAHD